jgi:hypothetical protein
VAEANDAEAPGGSTNLRVRGQTCSASGARHACHFSCTQPRLIERNAGGQGSRGMAGVAARRPARSALATKAASAREGAARERSAEQNRREQDEHEERWRLQGDGGRPGERRPYAERAAFLGRGRVEEAEYG